MDIEKITLLIFHPAQELYDSKLITFNDLKGLKLDELTNILDENSLGMRRADLLTIKSLASKIMLKVNETIENNGVSEAAYTENINHMKKVLLKLMSDNIKNNQFFKGLCNLDDYSHLLLDKLCKSALLNLPESRNIILGDDKREAMKALGKITKNIIESSNSIELILIPPIK